MPYNLLILKLVVNDTSFQLIKQTNLFSVVGEEILHMHGFLLTILVCLQSIFSLSIYDLHWNISDDKNNYCDDFKINIIHHTTSEK